MSDEKAKLVVAAGTAKAASEQWEREIKAKADNAARAARDAVMAEHEERTAELRKAKRETAAALRQHISDSAQHPWDGKRVYRMVTPRSTGYRYGRPPEKVREEGQVAIHRAGDRYLGNVPHYRRPSVGDLYVRNVLKSGEGTRSRSASKVTLACTSAVSFHMARFASV